MTKIIHEPTTMKAQNQKGSGHSYSGFQEASIEGGVRRRQIKSRNLNNGTGAWTIGSDELSVLLFSNK